jgi:hypothetical protein
LRVSGAPNQPIRKTTGSVVTLAGACVTALVLTGFSGVGVAFGPQAVNKTAVARNMVKNHLLFDMLFSSFR